jgi:5-methylcytosine-specific restriction endonuclease McrA
LAWKQANPAKARAQRSRRRARERAAIVERFTPLQVFERDGWRCQLCCRPVDRAAAVPDPDAPTLDHVIPLSAGGEHTRANTQCAHFLCNARKGAGVLRPEQLRLLG